MTPQNIESLIVQDVRERLADLRTKTPSAEWRMAVVASLSTNPTWYPELDSAGVMAVLKRVEPLLREAGIDLSTPERWRGNIDPVILDSLRKVRDQLLFDLIAQTAPPPEYAEPLWQAHKLLEEGIEGMTKASGIEEPQGQWITGEPDQS